MMPEAVWLGRVLSASGANERFNADQGTAQLLLPTANPGAAVEDIAASLLAFMLTTPKAEWIV